jgi:hypothetical protein
MAGVEVIRQMREVGDRIIVCEDDALSLARGVQEWSRGERGLVQVRRPIGEHEGKAHGEAQHGRAQGTEVLTACALNVAAAEPDR